MNLTSSMLITSCPNILGLRFEAIIGQNDRWRPYIIIDNPMVRESIDKSMKDITSHFLNTNKDLNIEQYHGILVNCIASPAIIKSVKHLLCDKPVSVKGAVYGYGENIFMIVEDLEEVIIDGHTSLSIFVSINSNNKTYIELSEVTYITHKIVEMDDSLKTSVDPKVYIEPTDDTLEISEDTISDIYEDIKSLGTFIEDEFNDISCYEPYYRNENKENEFNLFNECLV